MIPCSGVLHVRELWSQLSLPFLLTFPSSCPKSYHHGFHNTFSAASFYSYLLGFFFFWSWKHLKTHLELNMHHDIFSHQELPYVYVFSKVKHEKGLWLVFSYMQASLFCHLSVLFTELHWKFQAVSPFSTRRMNVTKKNLLSLQRNLYGLFLFRPASAMRSSRALAGACMSNIKPTRSQPWQGAPKWSIKLPILISRVPSMSLCEKMPWCTKWLERVSMVRLEMKVSPQPGLHWPVVTANRGILVGLQISAVTTAVHCAFMKCLYDCGKQKPFFHALCLT